MFSETKLITEKYQTNVMDNAKWSNTVTQTSDGNATSFFPIFHFFAHNQSNLFLFRCKIAILKKTRCHFQNKVY